MPAIIQSHTTGEGQSGIVGGYVRPPVISKQGGRPDRSGHASSVKSYDWPAVYEVWVAGYLNLLLVYQHRDSKGLGGVGTCCGDGAVSWDRQAGCIGKPFDMPAGSNICDWKSGDI